MKVSTFPESSFFDDLHSLTQLHHLSGELDMVLAFVRLDLGEHPDEDNFPPNFWLIRSVAEQLGALSVEAAFTRPHFGKMGRAVSVSYPPFTLPPAPRLLCLAAPAPINQRRTR
ncbi:hypothetical protein ACEE86_20670, partial [Proteus mirabilis]